MSVLLSSHSAGETANYLRIMKSTEHQQQIDKCLVLTKAHPGVQEVAQ
jgi:hypothetical protein